MQFKLYDLDYHEIPATGAVEQPAFFGFECPRGHGMCTYLRIRGGPRDDKQHPTWNWNGDRAKPTMDPSVNCLDHNPDNPSEKYAGCGWHGWIKNGECTAT